MVLQVQVDKGKNSRRCLDQLLSDRVHQRSTAPAFAVVRACRQLELPHARGRAMRTTWASTRQKPLGKHVIVSEGARTVHVALIIHVVHPVCMQLVVWRRLGVW